MYILDLVDADLPTEITATLTGPIRRRAHHRSLRRGPTFPTRGPEQDAEYRARIEAVERIAEEAGQRFREWFEPIVSRNEGMAVWLRNLPGPTQSACLSCGQPATLLMTDSQGSPLGGVL